MTLVWRPVLHKDDKGKWCEWFNDEHKLIITTRWTPPNQVHATFDLLSNNRWVYGSECGTLEEAKQVAEAYIELGSQPPYGK